MAGFGGATPCSLNLFALSGAAGVSGISQTPLQRDRKLKYVTRMWEQNDPC